MSNHEVGGRRRFEDSEFTLHIYPGSIAEGTIYCPVTARKSSTAAEVIDHVIERLRLDRTKCYVLAEVKEFGGEEWILNPSDCPVQRMMLWPRVALENRLAGEDYRFLLREKNLDGSIHYGSLQMWLRVTEERRRMVERGFLPQPPPGYHDDLCNLPDLNERTLLDNLRGRFRQEKIYTYVGSILIVINPFKFLPIYNPKYVKMYDKHQLGKLDPHIYAVADAAYHAMLQRRQNQCIVISGESGSGKTQSTNFLIHHLTALSQKGFASGVEQIILGAGPVLEAFGNAKTAHNNNSSRFGKFIQVNYQESGTVRGAYVEKYLLEKSRLVYQEHNERNYHVFYYLLAGASEEERKSFHLLKPEEYHYLNQMTKKSFRQHWENCYESELDCFTVEGEDLKHDFERLQLAMEMVGFLPATRKQIFSLLSAILHLGNIRYKKKTYRDDSIDICNPEVLPIVSELLEVKEEMLFEALTTRKTVTVGEKLIVPYKLAEAGTVRDSMAKSLYSALFDWIVFRTNHALFNNKDLEDNAKVRSLYFFFSSADFNNSFEQSASTLPTRGCSITFNQHIFKLEQVGTPPPLAQHRLQSTTPAAIHLISKKPTALFHLLDEECNDFPQATNQTLLDKFKRQHEGNSYIEFPAVMEPAFIIHHYAGKVKYGVKDFREKNTDHMRPDIVALLKSSKNGFIRGLISIEPVAMFRWAVLRAYFRALVAFREAGSRHRDKKSGNDSAVPCPVLKSVDSFSFLHHPVHQRSLEILQRCKDEKYNSCITRRNPRTPLSDLQGTNTFNEKSPRDAFGVGCNGRSSRPSRLSSTGAMHEEDGIFVNSTSSKLLERAQGILMRNKNYKLKPSLPKHLLDVKSLKYLSSLTLHDRITKSLLHLHKKKKPPSISAQFQASLNKLMETLGQSEPYFVKCIRSNLCKILPDLPLRFSDALVLRQLRYTGMLETVRIRQSGYSIKYTFQDFVRHFHVLLPHGTSATQRGIREFLRQIELPPDSFQVGITMVFLREVSRQRLQALLHEEVLRRIVALQRRFRALVERRHYCSLRLAACIIQRWWRTCQQRQPCELSLQQEAALCLQAAWRGYRARQRFVLEKEACVLLQRSWRRCLHQRGQAALLIQAAWRGYKQRELYSGLHGSILLLQAASRGYLARQSPVSEEDVNAEPDPQSQLSPEHSLSEWARAGGETPPAVSSLKSRAKRESRRKRELEQATFSLELLKVRSTGSSSALPEEQLAENALFPQGSPDSNSSQGSFELLSMDDVETELPSCPSPAPQELQPSCSTAPDEASPVPHGLSGSLRAALPSPEKQSPSSPVFYIPDEQISPVGSPSARPEVVSRGTRDRVDSTTRKPVVVVISMQKETLLRDVKVQPTELIDRCSVEALEHLERVRSETEEKPQPQVEREAEEQRPRVDALPMNKTCPSPHRTVASATELKSHKPSQSQSPTPMQQDCRAKKPPMEGSTVAKAWPQKKMITQTISISMSDRSGNVAFSPKRNRLTFSKSDKDLVNQERSMALQREERSGFRSLKTREVARPGHKKKARMARTRSDFLTRACNVEVDCESEDDEYMPVLSHTLPLPEPHTHAGSEQACHSDSEMPSQKDLKKMHKTMSSGDLGKVESLRKTPQQEGRMRGRMRFWSKTKHSEKKSSREKMSSRAGSADGALDRRTGPDSTSPPHSPDLTTGRGRDFKENKEPSPKVKRKRSVKISSVTLEPTQWQNDALQILTSATDYRSMNDFLMKKIGDLEAEDGKKDTMVDVVFKKALKEFRLNIFNSYSTALAMDDGRSIRYKDLYALFEHILEKTMRQEQRDWSESPVKVWVNTFKVFLDEFMTEYKPMDGTMSKAPKPERKKRRKKESDIVEEFNGHIFKATQYSIPTYCEFCSSLIWMMDRACVCKSYFLHLLLKQYDLEQSSRQFGVELSRLTSEDRAVPLVVEKLINYIEMHGLYTEGIYRKSGSTNKIKELKMGLDADANSMNLDDYNIHVIASVLKQWLRDLPNPLMTFELYEEFLRTTGSQDKREMIRGVYSVIDQLNRTHLSTLERLIFHLVRIAFQEETNRMSANALAIVFAPCILRCPDTIDPLQSVQDISKTTSCVELIICEQMNKYRARLKDINSLEFAENKAKSRLTLIRRSMGKGRLRRTSHHTPSPPMSPKLSAATDVEVAGEDGVESGLTEQQQVAMQQEERVLTEQIESLQKEKEELTYEMLSLEPRASDDETLESEASIGTADSSENLNLECEGAASELSMVSSLRSRKSDGKSRRPLRRQPDSLDSTSTISSISSTSSLCPQVAAGSASHYRFCSPSSGASRSNSPGDPLTPDGEERPVFAGRPALNSDRTRQKLRVSRNSPSKSRESSEGSGHRRDPDFGPTQQMVLYGSNEFMV
uniref:Unconventional myosin-IXa-like n=1 Tax=Denticeps clupeoides TaxID=299321 RepID=A0AAY4DGZ1_9TELE